MDEKDRKKNLRFVLVEPAHAGNIGASARALKNMGLEGLYLVNPAPFLVEEGFRMACAAKDVLLSASPGKTIAETVADARLVIGLTSRFGSQRGPHVELEEVIDRALDTARTGPVYFVFGREVNGLKNEELSLCHLVTEIPSHSDLRSLNLSQAVLVVAYELFKKSYPHQARLRAEESIHKKPPSTEAEMEHMYRHLEDVLRKVGYQDIAERSSRDVVKMVLLRFRRIFGRAGMEKRDVDTVEGFCSRIENTLKYQK
jgi:TrmH family RNA methyltransferase